MYKQETAPHFEGLTVVDPIPVQGSEKLVYQMNDGTQNIAAKIYIPNLPQHTLPIAELAVREFGAHEIFRRTSIAKYIPEPKYFLEHDDSFVGLAVDWRDGSPLDRAPLLRYLRSNEINELEERFTDLALEGIVPNMDMYSPGNIMVDVTRETDRIWIAECEILYSERYAQRYLENLKASFSQLRRLYQQRG